VFSERDVVRRVVAKDLDPSSTTVRDVMTTDVTYVSINESHHTAQALMLNKNFRHLVVVDEERRLRGFVSMRELLEVDLAESKQIIGSLNDDYYDHRFKPGVA
jgi:CBS domain-containing protein